MSFFSRILKRKPTVGIVKPDDQHMQEALTAAREQNTIAASSFAEAANRQRKDALMARRVIREILNRADRVKAIHNANIQK